MTKSTSLFYFLSHVKKTRSLLVAGGIVALAAALVMPALADGPAVTDFSNVDAGVIEAGDIVEALAVPRGTKVRAGARPRVRLPVYFEFNSAELKPEAKQLLQKVGKALTATDLDSFRFTVEGHTDSVGGESFNSNLSKRRAEIVRTFLQEHGVAQDRLQSIGRGESDPVDSNGTDKGRQHNRRVEIINLGAQS
jgi:outer membrane protein OmpA-like peptidoglycan-associated protein